MEVIEVGADPNIETVGKRTLTLDAAGSGAGYGAGPGATSGAGPTVDKAVTEIDVVLKALASQPRRKILLLLSDSLLNVSEIAAALDIPVSTANMHINVLEAAGLLRTEHRPASRGLQKLCLRVYDEIVVRLPSNSAAPVDEDGLETSMPIGAFVDCLVAPTCGLATSAGIIGLLDDPAAFYEPERVDAQLIWLRSGYLTYRFPNRLPPRARITSLTVSCEICSEAPLHHDDWPSDITLWINDVEVGTWTSPADFGGRRGSLTPAWWETRNSQYGMLKVWRVTDDGSWVDGVISSDVDLQRLGLAGSRSLDVKIGVKPGANNVGGLNLFGRDFGNYPQDLVLRMNYQRERNGGRS